jgi:hypothetical protein
VTRGGFDSLTVGDHVWCLAAVGVPYEVAALDRERGRLRLEPHPALTAARPLELSADTAWMLTKEPWDQIWYWPDRAGERFEDVVARFASAHEPGDVVKGYFLDDAIGSSNQGYVTLNPKLAMTFQIQRPTAGFGQVRVKPVMETPDGWEPVGPNVPLRVGMTSYRWSLSFGELILNWTDFVREE